MPVTQPSPRTRSRLAFLGLLGASAIGGVIAVAQFLKPREKSRVIRVGHLRDFAAGADPVVFRTDGAASLLQIPGHNQMFYVVRLSGHDARINGDGGQSGVVALASYCTHLGCTIPWRPEFTYDRQEGWFRCPCHGVTCTRAGARVFGPAPRGMDSHPVEIRSDGSIYVDRGHINPGAQTGPSPMTQIPQGLE